MSNVRAIFHRATTQILVQTPAFEAAGGTLKFETNILRKIYGTKSHFSSLAF